MDDELVRFEGRVACYAEPYSEGWLNGRRNLLPANPYTPDGPSWKSYEIGFKEGFKSWVENESS